jgi:integrase
MDAMPRPRLPYVRREVSRHKRAVWYFRRDDGPRVRLPDAYGSDEFMAAYQAALRGETPAAAPRAASETLAWLIERYKESAHWRGLDPVTQRRRDTVFRQMIERGGDAHMQQITAKVIRAGMNERAATGAWAANNFLKAVRPVFAFATSLEMIDADPTTGIKMLSEKTDGFPVWSEEHVARYEARHPIGTKARMALDLLLYTGMRLGDLVQIGRQHMRDGVLTYRPAKTRGTTGVVVTIRVLPPLADSIAACNEAGDMTLLVTQWGRPHASAQALAGWFKRRCREAGVPDVSAHGLRKAAATRAAEAGATTHELMSMFGWTKPTQAEVYTRAADRKRIGLGASDKLRRTSHPGAALNAENIMKSTSDR